MFKGRSVIDCVEWDGYLTPKGYGRIYVRGSGYGQSNGRYMLAHRWTWEQANGPVPDGMVVMHLCDNPACVELSHLRLGTQAENLADMKAKGRGHRWADTHTECKHGHPLDEENTWHGTRDGYPIRTCRTCVRLNMQRHRERRRRL